MRTTRVGVEVLLAAFGVLVVAACGHDEPAANASAGRTDSPSMGTVTPTPSRGGPASVVPNKENVMRIVINIGEQRFQASLAESAASRDLLAQLPQTVEMTDHGGVEKTGPLRAPLSLQGQPAGADPDVGDLGYYAPGNDLVLYYGDQSYFPGIVILGKLEGDAAQRIAEMAGRVTVAVEAG